MSSILRLVQSSYPKGSAAEAVACKYIRRPPCGAIRLCGCCWTAVLWYLSCLLLSLSCLSSPVSLLLSTRGPTASPNSQRGGCLKFLAAPGHPRILMGTPPRGQNGSRGLQDCSKRLRREPQEARTAQDGPKTDHDGPKTAQGAPKTAQEASKRPPKRAPRGKKH